MTSQRCHDIEEEKEEDKEKEIHSFIHSSAREDENKLNSYVQNKLNESELSGIDAQMYKKEIEEGLKLKYMRGELGQGVVLMSDEQFHYLCEIATIEELDKYFGIIVDCEKNGKHYKKKTHFQAILDMIYKDRRIK